MKAIKFLLICAFVTLGVVFTSLYSSCTKNACKATSCLNGSKCSGDICSCKEGTWGPNCETVYRDIYSNIYVGSGTDDSGKTFLDNSFTFTAGMDSDYNKMGVAWNNHGLHIVNMNITLTNNTPNGSTFTIASVKVDSSTYTGTGNVNKATASFTITETRTDSSVRTILLHNCNRQ